MKTRQQRVQQAYASLDRIKQFGFKEHWPPSGTCWYFYNKQTGLYLDFHWPSLTFHAWK